TANSARSQMAEAIPRKHAGDRFDVYSAGLEPAQIHPYAMKVMAEMGMDMAGQRAKGVSEFLGKMNPAYVIIVCEKARQGCPTAFPATGATMVAWPIDDPAEAEGTEEERLKKFRQARDQIEARIRDWLERGTRS
ncbi:MAG: arsenate reductase ArsC, partial [Planctomycetes bacterium]|nr:arsenate reductase ArsC [Planctomycetota bacterium]